MSSEQTLTQAVCDAIERKLPISEFERIMQLGFDRKESKQERRHLLKVAFAEKRNQNAARNKVE